MTQVVNMSKPFVVQVKNDRQRLIIIDKEAWEEEELQKGDYIEVKIRKITLDAQD